MEHTFRQACLILILKRGVDVPDVYELAFRLLLGKTNTFACHVESG